MHATGGYVTRQPCLAQTTLACLQFGLRVYFILEYTYQVGNLHAHSGARFQLHFLKGLFMFSGESKPSRIKRVTNLSVFGSHLLQLGIILLAFILVLI